MTNVEWVEQRQEQFETDFSAFKNLSIPQQIHVF